jgi:hypothetical protein
MNQSFVAEDPARFESALRRFDEENSQDPNREPVNGQQLPRELVYARWLSEWVLRLSPRASEALRLAARAAHLRRWSIARSSYEMTRGGYLRWRADLKKFHAQCAGNILQEIGYPKEMVERVCGLISKSLFPQDPESRVLEDALCLLFLERQFAGLAEKSTDEKLINALQKTWAKMTPQAKSIALTLTYDPRERSLLDRALPRTHA